MAEDGKKFGNLGLWVPQNILKMQCLSGDEKLYYAHIYSFGERGCWQTDEQIGRALGRDVRTLQRYQADCRKAGLLKVVGKQSKYRRIWAKHHPKFKAAQKSYAQQLGQTCQSGPTELSELLGQTCPTTNTCTNKQTNKQGGGSPSPARGQAHTPPKDKQQELAAHATKEDALMKVKQLEQNFGTGHARRKSRLSEAEFEKRRQNGLKGLLASTPA